MITIIVPVYNVEPYLSQCLDSILAQTYTDLEILLIDDGSTDCSGKICDQYAARDSRIRVFHTEKRDLSAARNLGLDYAHGDFIGFVDSDDWVEPDMYECLLMKANQTNADITECGVLREFPGKTIECKKSNTVFSGVDAVLALLQGYLGNGVWNKLWKANCFKSIRFPEGRIYEDIATTYRVFIISDSICSTDIFKYHYRQRDKSLSKCHDMRNLVSYWLAQRERYENLKEQVDDRLKDELLRKCALAATRT